MDPAAMGAAAAEKGMVAEEDDESEDIPAHERMPHRVKAMAEFADALARHDHTGMAHALAAHDALLDDSDKAAGVSEKGRPEEDGAGEE